jgi:lysozyme
MRHAPALLAVLLFAACDRTPDLELARSEQGLKVCPGPATVPGIDVSEWQGSIDWAQVAGSGVKFAITRINDGHHMDPYFQANWDAIKAVGLVRGAYQFYEPNIDAALQASWVVQAVGVLGPGDLPVMLDVEWTSGTPNAQGIGTWLSQVEAGTGKRPLIYTALGYWNQYFTSEFGDYDLVVANYGVQCPNLPASWTGWFMWQWGGRRCRASRGTWTRTSSTARWTTCGWPRGLRRTPAAMRGPTRPAPTLAAAAPRGSAAAATARGRGARPRRPRRVARSGATAWTASARAASVPAPAAR